MQHIIETIFLEGHKEKFNCLKELNDLLIKLGWRDVGEMYFQKDKYDFGIGLLGIKKIEGKYYPIMSFRKASQLDRKSNLKLQDEIRQFLEDIGYGRIIDQDTSNGFLYDIYDLVNKELSIKIIASKSGNHFFNHYLEGDSDLGKLHLVLNRIKKEGLEYFNDINI